MPACFSATAVASVAGGASERDGRPVQAGPPAGAISRASGGDGVALRTFVKQAGYGADFVTVLCPLWPPGPVQGTVRQLLEGSRDSGEQVDMLVCPGCGDRDFGAVLADVMVTAEEVVWSGWRWTDYNPHGGRELFFRPPVETTGPLLLC